jgi:hypothetical protein
MSIVRLQCIVKLEDAECSIIVVVVTCLEAAAARKVFGMAMMSLKQVEFACEGVPAGHNLHPHLRMPPS